MTVEEIVRSYDSTAHLVMDGVMSALLTGVGFGLRKLWKALQPIIAVPHRIDRVERRQENHAEVIDEHSDILIRAGWTKGRQLPRLSKQRREVDSV